MDYFGPDNEVAKHAIDALSVGTVLGALAGILPSIATTLTIIWMCIRIYESPTVQGWLGKGGDDGGAQ